MATKRKVTTTEGPVAKARKPAVKSKAGDQVSLKGKRMTTAADAGKPKRKTAAKPKAKAAISTDLIALRAYFIGEKRTSTGQPGDSLTDWLEAERQLIAEQK